MAKKRADMLEIIAYQTIESRKRKVPRLDISPLEAIDAIEDGWEFEAEMLPWIGGD